MTDDLRRAVERWVRADYYAHAPNPRLADVVGPLIDAEDELRRALTGEADLVRAASALGCRLDPLHERLVGRPPGRPHKRPKRRRRARLLEDPEEGAGLF